MYSKVGEMVDDEVQAEGVSNAMGQAEGGGAGADEAARNTGREQEAEVVQQEEEEEEEEALEEPDEETLGKMTSMEQRLFKIRLKMNKVPARLDGIGVYLFISIVASWFCARGRVMFFGGVLVVLSLLLFCSCLRARVGRRSAEYISDVVGV